MKNRRQQIHGIVLILTALLLCQNVAFTETACIPGQPFPDLTVTDTEGTELRVLDLLQENDLLVLALFREASPQREILNSLSQFADGEERVFLMGLSDEAYDALADFAKETDLSLPMAHTDDERLLELMDPEAGVTLIYLDSSGSVEEIGNPDGFVTTVDRLLNQTDPGIPASGFGALLPGIRMPGGPYVYTVTVTDQDANPVPGVYVNFCTDDMCALQQTDGFGQILYEAENTRDIYHLQIIAVPEGYSFDRDEETYMGGTETELTLVIRKD